jgi:Protein of unknown function (DUF1761)
MEAQGGPRGLNYLAIAVATVVAFVEGSLYYSPFMFGPLWMRLSGMDASAAAKVSPWAVVGEITRDFVLTYVVARLVARLTDANWRSATGLGLWLWVGFPLMLLSGSVMWQGVSWKIAAIHAGDWLVKLLLITTIVGAWAVERTRAPVQ